MLKAGKAVRLHEQNRLRGWLPGAFLRVRRNLATFLDRKTGHPD
jgi:hypothetical protein